MAKMQRTIHVWIWEGTHPFWIFLSDFSWRELLRLVGRGCIYFKYMLVIPYLLVFLLNGLQGISFACLWYA